MNFANDIGENDLLRVNLNGETTNLEDKISKEVHTIAFIEKIDSLMAQMNLVQDDTAVIFFDTLKQELMKGIENNTFHLTIGGEKK